MLYGHADRVEQLDGDGERVLGLIEPTGVRQRDPEVELELRMLHREPCARVATQPGAKHVERSLKIVSCAHAPDPFARRRTYPTDMRIIVAGMGNVLRGDDGFGVVVARCLLDEPIPEGVLVLELGIGGIHLVQELMDPVDALIVVDAVDLGRSPGTVFTVEPEVPDVAAMTPSARGDQLADMHYSTPERAFVLARGLGILPVSLYVVGCQPGEMDTFVEGLSRGVSSAVEEAIGEIRRLVTELGVPWD